MNIGLIPSDNMYKFMALSGIAIILFSITIPNDWLQDAEKRASENSLAIDLLRADIDLYEAKRNKAISAGKISADDNALYAIERMEKFKPKLIEIAQRQHDLGRDLKRQTYALFVSVAGMLIGLALCYSGFRLWYLRIQRPQDLELAEKSKRAAEYLLGRKINIEPQGKDKVAQSDDQSNPPV